LALDESDQNYKLSTESVGIEPLLCRTVGAVSVLKIRMLINQADKILLKSFFEINIYVMKYLHRALV